MTTSTGRIPPTPDAESQPFFDAAKEGKLLIKQCPKCLRYLAPQREVCDNCFAYELSWVEASGKGLIYTFGIVHQVVHPSFAGEVPYNVITVELDEGPRINSNLVGTDHREIQIGKRVEAVFERVGDVTVPKFRIVE
jgi:uncharacterized OB-fold protein